jgi:cob(I)alamin adenosyltransferase
MKIYTKTGDSGTTSLPGGANRASKADMRLEVLGAIDEVISIVGATGSSLSEPDQTVLSEIWQIQSDLMGLAAGLARTGPAGAGRESPGSTEKTPLWLEASIDRMEKGLPAVKSFILPGGHPAAAWAHVARAVCRRAERRVAALAESAAHPEVRDTLPAAMTYLNRLSDYLFVLARYLNHLHGVAERPWRP